MPREPIPEDLRRFLLTSVPSVPFVEALLIYRDARSQPVDDAMIARRLYMSDRNAAQVIEQLRLARFVRPAESAGAHHFHPETLELAGMIEQLAAFYRTHLVEVSDLIHSRTSRKAQQFADAFKLRKEP